MSSPGPSACLFLLALALVTLVGAPAPAQDEERIVRVGTFQLQPVNFIDEEGVARGLYPDLIRSIAEEHDWHLEFVAGDWPTCLDRLQSGEIDLMTTIAYTPERAKTMDFSQEAVCDIWGQVYVRPGDRISGVRDLDGRSVGIMRRDINGANFEQLIERLRVACEIRQFASHDEVFAATERGEVAGAVAPQHFGLRNADRYGLVGSTIQFAPFSVFFATRKGANTDLLRGLDERLIAWKDDPDSYYYDRLNHWMGVEPVERQVFPPWLIAAIVGALVLAAFLLIANRLLNARVQSRTLELHRREREYRGLVESANCVIVRLDPEGRIKYMNPYGLRLFGFRTEDLLGRSVVGTFVPETEQSGRDMAELVEDVLADPGEYELTENENVCQDGTRLYMQWSNRAVLDERGNLTEFLSVGIDNTERRRLQNDLLRARKMEALGTLAGGIAHDFNNMLHGIMGASELLSATAREDQRRHVEIIHTSSRRAAELIGQMMAFSRTGEFTMKPVDLRQIVGDAVTLLERSIDKKVTIDVDMDPDCWVRGNSAQLQNVFINLGINAGHAMMPEGGRLRIASERVQLDDATCRASGFRLEAGPFVSLTITDEGHGIPEEDLTKIFEPFYTTKSHEDGTGLGLAAVFGIVQTHGGSIDVQSSPGSGTCFTVLLPAAQPGEEPPAAETDRVQYAGTILIVDDEPLVREMSAELLRTLGYRVEVAVNGKEAIQLYERDPDAIDGVLLDMVMPVMNGRETAEVLKRLRPDLPIVIASGYAQDDSIADLRDLGVQEVLVKPFGGTDLERVFARVIPHREGRGG